MLDKYTLEGIQFIAEVTEFNAFDYTHLPVGGMKKYSWKCSAVSIYAVYTVYICIWSELGLDGETTLTDY